MREEEIKQKQLLDAIRMLSPGMPLREGLENILKGKMGALIVVGDSEAVMKIVDGGFAINVEFTPAYLYELAKMDGAIILSRDVKRILYANTQLIPNPEIHSSETGIRHRIAERVARETEEVVISISQRRNIISLYRGNTKYIVQDTGRILTKANQAIQTLEKYKVVLDTGMNNLSALEYEDLVTIYDVAVVLQRAEMVMRVVQDIDKFICELGNEGRLISMQQEELVANVATDWKYVINDYKASMAATDQQISKNIKSLSSEELLDLSNIAKTLGYDGNITTLDLPVSSRGYRILSKIPRLPGAVIDNLVKHFCEFQPVLKATIEKLDEVEGIGEIRARAIKEGLARLREQVMLGRPI